MGVGDFKITFDRAAEKKLLEAGPLAVLRAAEEIEREAKKVPPSPYLTGTNRRSIIRALLAKDTWIIATTSGYGFFLEFGTKFMRAQPFLRPAFEAVRGRVDAIIAKVRKETSG